MGWVPFFRRKSSAQVPPFERHVHCTVSMYSLVSMVINVGSNLFLDLRFGQGDACVLQHEVHVRRFCRSERGATAAASAEVASRTGRWPVWTSMGSQQTSRCALASCRQMSCSATCCPVPSAPRPHVPDKWALSISCSIFAFPHDACPSRWQLCLLLDCSRVNQLDTL